MRVDDGAKAAEVERGVVVCVVAGRANDALSRVAVRVVVAAAAAAPARWRCYRHWPAML